MSGIMEVGWRGLRPGVEIVPQEKSSEIQMVCGVLCRPMLDTNASKLLYTYPITDLPPSMDFPGGVLAGRWKRVWSKSIEMVVYVGEDGPLVDRFGAHVGGRLHTSGSSTSSTELP